MRHVRSRLVAAALALLLGASVAAASDELLKNGSFEAGDTRPAQWTFEISARNGDRGAESSFALDDEIARDGERSLRLSGDGSTVAWYAALQPVPVEAGSRYVVSAWMRTRDVHREGRQYFNANVFVQFRDAAGGIIRTEGDYPVIGTKPLGGTADWQRVERIVRAPDGAVSANVGCFLSCSGAAWFDEVSVRTVDAEGWNERRTSRFELHWIGDDAPPQGSIEGNERHLARLEDLLGVEIEGPIQYFKYPDNDRKGEMTGNRGNAHVEGEDEIHSIFWSDRHEVVHLLTKRWGGGTALLAEGIAVYLSGGWNGRTVDEAARALAESGRLVALADLVDTSRFRALDEEITYPESASFVKYLFVTFGLERFRELYRSVPLDPGAERFDACLREMYGIGIDEAERAWREQAGLPRPSGGAGG